MAAIDVAGLTKTYRYHRKEPGFRGSVQSLLRRRTLETHAVTDVSFTIAAGEIVGFLGPNGAGKTTTLKLLSGLLYPSGGTAHVLGFVPHRREHAYLRRITLVMGQRSMLWWDLPALETLLLHKCMYGIPDAAFRRTTKALGELLEVEHLLRVQVRKLSLGERMKMELIASLVHQPEVVFLDEPTIGLDVIAQQRVRTFLRQLNQEHGTTILLTSHYMADVEALCSRVILIDGGRLRFDGPLNALVEQATPKKLVSARYADPVAPEAASAALAHLGIFQRHPTHTPHGLENLHDSRVHERPVVQPDANPLTLNLEVPRERVAEVAECLLRLGHLVDLSIEAPPVEDIIRSVFRRRVGDPAGGSTIAPNTQAAAPQSTILPVANAMENAPEART